MPILRSRTVLDVTKSLKAFLNLEAGLIRGKVPSLAPSPRQDEPDKQLVEGVQARKVNAKNIIWILGSPRTGSTWLSRILGDLTGHLVWNEPFFGVVLARNHIVNREYLKHKNFILGEPHKEVWIKSMRRLFLDVCENKFPDINHKHYLIVKEPNGSLSAPLIMEAFPESKLVFLIRDGRDVVASVLDATRKGGWDKYGSEVATQQSDEEFVEQLARNYLAHVSAVGEAYANHPDGLKATIRYEELRTRPFESIQDVYRALHIDLNEAELKKAIEKYSWDNVPAEKKGEGKFFRKAKPGSWREDLTEQQARIVERVLDT